MSLLANRPDTLISPRRGSESASLQRLPGQKWGSYTSVQSNFEVPRSVSCPRSPPFSGTSYLSHQGRKTMQLIYARRALCSTYAHSKLTTQFALAACVLAISSGCIADYEDGTVTDDDLSDPLCEATDVDSINQYLAEAVQANMPESTITQEITRRWCNLSKVSTPSTRGITPSTSVTDVDWSNMSMFWDNQARVYVATASWRWTRQGYLDHDFVVCTNNNIGGNSGVGIRFSGGGMNILGKSATAWGNPAKDSYNRDFGFMSVPHSLVGEYGVGFKAQGIATKLQNSSGACTDGQYDYNMWGGSATITFKSLNGCRNVQMYPGYVHTWDSTSINSIGAGPSSFSIGWSSAGDSWTKEENGPTATICP
jgi:hypothetical protein